LNKDSPPLESLKPLLEAQTSGFWEHCEVPTANSFAKSTEGKEVAVNGTWDKRRLP